MHGEASWVTEAGWVSACMVRPHEGEGCPRQGEWVPGQCRSGMFIRACSFTLIMYLIINMKDGRSGTATERHGLEAPATALAGEWFATDPGNRSRQAGMIWFDASQMIARFGDHLQDWEIDREFTGIPWEVRGWSQDHRSHQVGIAQRCGDHWSLSRIRYLILKIAVCGCVALHVATVATAVSTWPSWSGVWPANTIMSFRRKSSQRGEKIQSAWDLAHTSTTRTRNHELMCRE